MMRCAECQQAAQFGRQGQAGPLWPHDQQHRQAERIGQVPHAGGVAHAAKAVVVPHCALDHGGAMTRCIPGIQAAHGGRIGEKQIQIVAFHPQNGAVEHRVDVIRPRFKGTGLRAARLQGRQQRTGSGRFAAAGTRCRQNQLQHLTPSRSKIPGCWPSTSAGCPPLWCGLRRSA